MKVYNNIYICKMMSLNFMSAQIFDIAVYILSNNMRKYIKDDFIFITFIRNMKII